MKKSLRTILTAIVVISLCFLGIAEVGCKMKSSSKPSIAVSIPPQKYLLDRIVGGKFDVVCLLSQGSNPEAYEPSMNHLITLERSAAYFRIGNIGFELAIVNKAKQNKPDLKVYDNSTGVTMILGTHGHHRDHSPEVDPHIWTSAPNAKIIAHNMLDAVVELDPDHKAIYKKNYDSLAVELDSLNAQIARRLADAPSRSFIVWHPSLSYYARDYGLNQVSFEAEGKEASAQHLKENIDKAKASGAKVFFLQKEFDSRSISQISDELGTRLVEINPMNDDVIAELNQITDALAAK